jgi:flavodoxin I
MEVNGMQALIVYYSLTGNTAQAAKYIAKGLEAENVGVTKLNVYKAKPEDLNNKDFIIIGSPTHVSAPAMEIRRFLNKLPEKAFVNKKVAVFTTYTLWGGEAALSTIEEIVRDKGATKLLPGLARQSNILRNLLNVVTGSTETEEAWIAFGKQLATS